MFAYCGNNPVIYFDRSGNVSMRIFGDTFDILDMPWHDPHGGGGPTYIYVKDAYIDSFALIEESEGTSSGGKKEGKILGGQISTFEVNAEGFSLISASISAVSMDLSKDNSKLSLFNLGNLSAEVGCKGMLPRIGAMVSLWSPSYTYSFGKADVTITFHVGAVGAEFSPDPSNFKIGFAKGFGFSFSIS